VEIIIDVARASQGRLAGTLRLVGSAESRDFVGVMELLARLERFIDMGAAMGLDALQEGD
jgi:hypothetical protein